MCARVIVVLIALALLGASFGAPEPLAPAGSSLAWAHHDAEDGSVSDHRIDDVPAQAHTETAADGSVLLMAYAPAMPARPGVVRPRARAAGGHPAPWLDGPQRPPRGLSAIA